MTRQKSALERVQVRVSFTRQEMDALEGLLALGMFGTSIPEVVSRIVGADLDRRKRGIVMPDSAVVSTGSSGWAPSEGRRARVYARDDDMVSTDPSAGPFVGEAVIPERVIEPMQDHEPTAEEVRQALTRNRRASMGLPPPGTELTRASLTLDEVKRKLAETGTLKKADELVSPWGVKEEE